MFNISSTSDICVIGFILFLFQNTTVIAKPNYNGALFSQIREGGVDFMWQNLSVNMTGVVNFIRENIGIFQSVSHFV